jgi:hypothetical protein
MKAYIITRWRLHRGQWSALCSIMCVRANHTTQPNRLHVLRLIRYFRYFCVCHSTTLSVSKLYIALSDTMTDECWTGEGIAQSRYHHATEESHENVCTLTYNKLHVWFILLSAEIACWTLLFVSEQRTHLQSSVCCLLHGGFLFVLLFNPANGGDKFTRNVGCPKRTTKHYSPEDRITQIRNEMDEGRFVILLWM